MPRRIYKVKVSWKSGSGTPMIWKGPATNVMDAFARARHAMDPVVAKNALVTLLMERTDSEA